MRSHFLILAALVAPHSFAQNVTLNLGELLTNGKNIVLTNSTKSFVELKSVDFDSSWGSTFGKTFSVKIDPSFPKFTPEVINFCDINPTKGSNICFIKLLKDDNKLKGKMDKGFSGNSTHSDFTPYPGKKPPVPVKQSNGKYTINLTDPLSPGYYAFASDGKAWIFEVPEIKP